MNQPSLIKTDHQPFIHHQSIINPPFFNHYLTLKTDHSSTITPRTITSHDLLQVEEGLRPGRVADIEGLWLTGQDVTTNGFAGALMGGVVTAHGILGYGLMDLAICKRDAGIGEMLDGDDVGW